MEFLRNSWFLFNFFCTPGNEQQKRRSQRNFAFLWSSNRHFYSDNNMCVYTWVRTENSQHLILLVPVNDQLGGPMGALLPARSPFHSLTLQMRGRPMLLLLLMTFQEFLWLQPFKLFKRTNSEQNTFDEAPRWVKLYSVQQMQQSKSIIA